MLKKMTKKQKKQFYKIVAAFVLLIVGVILPIPELYKLIFFIPGYLIVGYDVLAKAGKNITKGQVFDENFLMAIATIGAFALQEYTEGIAVMLFYQVGELFQSYAVNQSRKSVASLMDIRPDSAVVLRDGVEEEVFPDEVAVGETIIVKPGERIPLDGIVLEGSSMEDTKALTGEAVPRKVSVGDEIISGCINLTNILKIRTTKEYGESTVARILDLVENASSQKAKVENFITKFARYYTPIVVGLAAFIGLIVPIFLPGHPFAEWIYRALSFLVCSCPCALVISVPLSFFGGIGCASKNGVLVKGSNYLEAVSKAETMVFDKTGTLTKGTFRVTKLAPVERKQRVITSFKHSYSRAVFQSSNRIVCIICMEGKKWQRAGKGRGCTGDCRKRLKGNCRWSCNPCWKSEPYGRAWLDSSDTRGSGNCCIYSSRRRIQRLSFNFR